MSSVDYPDDAVTKRDIKTALEDVLAEIKQFVTENTENNTWEYREFELVTGITLVCDWEVEGVRDTHLAVDTETVGDWYCPPTHPEVTKREQEHYAFSSDEKHQAWGMALLRPDASMKSTPDPISDRYLVEIDHSQEVAPRELTRTTSCFDDIDHIPETYEFSPLNSNVRTDIWL